MAKLAEIKDLDGWLYAVKRKNPNVRLGNDGSLQIYDPKNPDTDPRIIPHLKGIDAYRILGEDIHPELRAAATAKLTEIEVAIGSVKDPLFTAVDTAEQEYLLAVEQWETTKTIDHALAVGRAQRVLADKEAEYRAASFKHRSILSLQDVSRIMIDYRTKDMRKVGHTIQLARYDTTLASERTIPIVEGTA